MYLVHSDRPIYILDKHCVNAALHTANNKRSSYRATTVHLSPLFICCLNFYKCLILRKKTVCLDEHLSTDKSIQTTVELDTLFPAAFLVTCNSTLLHPGGSIEHT